MHRPARTFLIIFSGLITGLLLLIAAINYLIDPFDYFKGLSPDGLSKQPLQSHERFDRAIKIMIRKPQAILLGSSRVKAGFSQLYFSQLVGKSAYKAAFNGARFDEIYNYFEHALFNQPDLKDVFIGIDFFAFSETIKPVSEYSLKRLKRETLPFDDFFKLLLSQEVLKLSYENHPFKQVTPKQESRFFAKIDEHEYIGISQSMIEKPQMFFESEKIHIMDSYKIDEKKVEMFRRLVETCNNNHIRLKVVFLPVHNAYGKFIYDCDRWRDFEDLKRQLCSCTPIYDFSGFTALNAEVLSNEEPSTYFFEFSHFSPIYGKIILDKIYGIEDRCPDSGKLLTPENIEDHLKIQSRQRDAWLEQNMSNKQDKNRI
ncbi:MAG: hypothetical protein BGO14_08485 [Chlamydiales bacterium 38-26]|nr:hypothetical protein [Chlamydiales bacterium]OJV11025.1 MAG: hypothetical protein BGO14_08485 [Chlamydiales bacterium 38-26]